MIRRRRRALVALAVGLTAAAIAGAPGSGGAGGAGVVASAPGDTEPPFEGTAETLDPDTRARVTGISWRRGCPVPLEDLRLLSVSHWGFDKRAHTGRLIVHRDAATAILGVMEKLYSARFPIRRMRLIDAYGARDRKSMAADNTSAFNCRFVAGKPGVWSEHAYGRAIDLNPIENPYVTGSGYVSPPAGRRFARRSRRAPGMVHAGDSTVRAFAAAGWEWAGKWAWPKDYQHFSANGN